MCDVYTECPYELKEYVRFVGVTPQDACRRCSIFSYHCLTLVPGCIEISIDDYSAAKKLPRSILLNTLYHELGHAIQYIDVIRYASTGMGLVDVATSLPVKSQSQSLSAKIIYLAEIIVMEVIQKDD